MSHGLEDATAHAEDDITVLKEFVILTQSFRVVDRRKRSLLDKVPLQGDMNLVTRISSRSWAASAENLSISEEREAAYESAGIKNLLSKKFKRSM